MSGTEMRSGSKWWWWLDFCGYALLPLVLVLSTTFAQEEDTEILQKELLKFLGIEKPSPPSAALPPVPSFMRDLYKDENLFRKLTKSVKEARQDRYYQYSSPDTVRNIASILEIDEGTEFRPGVGRIRIKFAIMGIAESERLFAAQLRVTHFSAEQSNSNCDVPFLSYIRAYDVVRVLQDNSTVLRLLDTVLVDRRKAGVLNLDVGSAVERWVINPETNYGLVLEMDPHHDSAPSTSSSPAGSSSPASYLRIRRAATESDEEWVEKRPSLLVYSDSVKEGRRVKRDKLSAPYEKCKKHSLYVDFKMVKWQDWIVAPHGYYANYCRGECEFPFADHMNTTNHAIIQSLVNSRYPDRVPKACCIPSELSSFSLLYIDEQKNIILKNYQDMVVEACGCR